MEKFIICPELYLILPMLPNQVLACSPIPHYTYSIARDSDTDCQLRVEVMSPDSRYRTNIVTSIDALEMIDR